MQNNNLLRLQFDYSTMVYLDIIIRMVHFSLHHTKQKQLGTLTQRNHKISIYGQYVNRCNFNTISHLLCSLQLIRMI